MIVCKTFFLAFLASSHFVHMCNQKCEKREVKFNNQSPNCVILQRAPSHPQRKHTAKSLLFKLNEVMWLSYCYDLLSLNDMTGVFCVRLHWKRWVQPVFAPQIKNSLNMLHWFPMQGLNNSSACMEWVNSGTYSEAWEIMRQSLWIGLD